MNGDNSHCQDKSFGLTMILRLTENGPLERYALTLIDNQNFLNSAGKKIDLQKEDIAHNANQRWVFGHGESSTIIHPELHNDIVWDVADKDNLNPPEKTPFYTFPVHGRHNQHFIIKKGMIFAKQNGHVVTYVGGDKPFVMMQPKESLKERQTFYITPENLKNLVEEPPVPKDVTFKCNISDPFNGILMHLTKKTNGNIQINHTIDITSSSLSCGNYEPLVDYQNINGHAHIAGSPRWLQFDLKNRKAEIDSYLIKSAHTDEDRHSSYYLKNWRLEISMNGSDWSLIDERSNDSELNGNYKIHLYKLNKLSKPFRYIRIISNGGNWNNDDFTIGKLELYGNLIE